MLATHDAHQATLSAQEEARNIACFEQFIAQVIGRGDLSALDSFVTHDIAVHDPGTELYGQAALHRGLCTLLAAFPDFQLVVEDLIAAGDKVVARYRGEGYHLGTWRGIPATGKRISYSGILIQRFADGRIAEHWAEMDLLG